MAVTEARFSPGRDRGLAWLLGSVMNEAQKQSWHALMDLYELHQL
jgi:hypothetical protein